MSLCVRDKRINHQRIDLVIIQLIVFIANKIFYSLTNNSISTSEQIIHCSVCGAVETRIVNNNNDIVISAKIQSSSSSSSSSFETNLHQTNTNIGLSSVDSSDQTNESTVVFIVSYCNNYDIIRLL